MTRLFSILFAVVALVALAQPAHAQFNAFNRGFNRGAQGNAFLPFGGAFRSNAFLRGLNNGRAFRAQAQFNAAFAKARFNAALRTHGFNGFNSFAVQHATPTFVQPAFAFSRGFHTPFVTPSLSRRGFSFSRFGSSSFVPSSRVFFRSGCGH